MRSDGLSWKQHGSWCSPRAWRAGASWSWRPPPPPPRRWASGLPARATPSCTGSRGSWSTPRRSSSRNGCDWPRTRWRGRCCRRARRSGPGTSAGSGRSQTSRRCCAAPPTGAAPAGSPDRMRSIDSSHATESPLAIGAPGREPMARRALRGVRRSLGDNPAFLPVVLRAGRSGPRGRITPETQLVVEGFPASGSTFAHFAVLHADRRASVTSPIHAPSQLKRAVRRGKPALLIVRAPEDAVASLAIAAPQIAVTSLLSDYVHYHSELIPLLDSRRRRHLRRSDDRLRPGARRGQSPLRAPARPLRPHAATRRGGLRRGQLRPRSAAEARPSPMGQRPPKIGASSRTSCEQSCAASSTPRCTKRP